MNVKIKKPCLQFKNSRRRSKNNMHHRKLAQKRISNNNIPHLIDIDYIKLANVIVNAQQIHNEDPKIVKEDDSKSSFLKSMIMILKGKKDTGERLTTGIFAILLSVLFQTLAIIGWIISIISIYVGIKQVSMMKWDGLSIIVNILSLVSWLSIVFIIVIYSVFIWGAAKELDKTEDKDFVVSVFSGVVSLAALIVALIAFRCQIL